MASFPRDMTGMLMELMGAGGHPGALDPTKLRQFLGGAGPNNQWMNIGPYETYLRRGMERQIQPGTRLKRPLDLANINRTDLGEEHAKAAMTRQPAKFRPPRGRFRELLALLEQEAQRGGYDSVYAENIMNEFLPDVLASAGYLRDPRANLGDARIPSMYKRLG